MLMAQVLQEAQIHLQQPVRQAVLATMKMVRERRIRIIESYSRSETQYTHLKQKERGGIRQQQQQQNSSRYIYSPQLLPLAYCGHGLWGHRWHVGGYSRRQSFVQQIIFKRHISETIKLYWTKKDRNDQVSETLTKWRGAYLWCAWPSPRPPFPSQGHIYVYT